MTNHRQTTFHNNGEVDALELLHTEHVRLLEMFGKLSDATMRHGRVDTRLAVAACKALTHHSRIEADIFYPALRAALKPDDLLDASRAEHRTLDELVVELSHSDPHSSDYQGKVDAVAMYLAHHIREEETRLFPRARASGVDLIGLAQKIARRNAELER